MTGFLSTPAKRLIFFAFFTFFSGTETVVVLVLCIGVGIQQFKPKIKFTKSDKPDFPASVENEIYKRQLFSIPCICGRWGARDPVDLGFAPTEAGGLKCRDTV